MKILYVAPASDFSSQIASALSALGHVVKELDDRLDYSMPVVMRRSRLLWRASRRVPWQRRRANAALQRVIQDEARGCDVLLAVKGMNIRPETLKAMTAMRVKTAVWFPDNAANEPYASWVRRVGPVWGHFFSFDSAIFEQIPNADPARTHALPFAVDAEQWNPGDISESDREKFSCDVAFVGAPYPDRVELLSKVAPICDLRIWGWSGWKKTPLAGQYKGSLNTRESAKVYSLAKVSVNTNIRPRAHGVNLKTFEICAAGGFQLTDICTDLAGSFEIRRELDVFSDSNEFVRKVQYWLEHAEERTAIARAARERVLRDHTLGQRMQQMLSIINT